MPSVGVPVLQKVPFILSCLALATKTVADELTLHYNNNNTYIDHISIIISRSSSSISIVIIIIIIII